MNCDLLVCVKVEREKFHMEDYKGEDDILALVESGSFSFDDGGGVQTVYPLDAVVFKKGKRYKRKIIDKAAMYLFRYKSDCEIFPQSYVRYKNRERIKSTLELLNTAKSTLGTNEFIYKKSLFSDLVIQYILENSDMESTLCGGDAVMRSVLEKIDTNLHKKINLASLADECFLSYVQFSRRFKRSVGMSAQDYISSQRMKKAEQMLAGSDLTVKTVSAECGFANEYYFSNFFKNYYGLSPSEYRKIFKNS